MRRGAVVLPMIAFLAACSDATEPVVCADILAASGALFAPAVQVTPLDRATRAVGVVGITGTLTMGDSVYTLDTQTNSNGKVVRLTLLRLVAAGDYTVTLTSPASATAWVQQGSLLLANECGLYPVELAAWF